MNLFSGICVSGGDGGLWLYDLAGVSSPWPMGHMRPRMAMNVAQHKIVNLLKTFFWFMSFC